MCDNFDSVRRSCSGYRCTFIGTGNWISSIYSACSGNVYSSDCHQFFIVAGNAQAAVAMPIMVPVADMVGVSRQTAVLAFNFGDGLSNYILPHSSALMGFIGMANIPYDRWMRFMLKLFAIWAVVAMIIVAFASVIQYS